VFVTNDFFQPTQLSEPPGADALCQAAADGADLGGCWHAWLSDNDSTALDAVCPGGPWVRVDAMPVALDCTDLTDGNILLPIDRTENGLQVSVGVWTGTGQDGLPLQHCSGWSNDDEMDKGTQGNSFGLTDWSNGFETTCSDVGSLYCFER
jgi:hypothetical protein